MGTTPPLLTESEKILVGAHQCQASHKRLYRPMLRKSRYTYWADAFQYACEDPVTFEILSEDLVCGKGYTCPDGYVCAKSGHAAINHGLTGYHDIWHAMLQVRGTTYSPAEEGLYHTIENDI